nr:hypothetical protein [Bacillota bacterium]
MKYMYQPQTVLGKCVLGAQAGPQSIIVRQVVGENSMQKSIDISIVVPKNKPAIEQIIDVLIKKVRITNVDVLTNKVIVCGDFEVKGIYVACLPNQPVHAVEARRIRFTVDVPIRRARRGMDAEARVIVNSVDYDCDSHTRAHWYKQNYDQYNWDDKHNQSSDSPEYNPHHKPCWCPPEKGCTNKFKASVELSVIVKVMTDRELVIYPGTYPGLPPKPKG